MFYVVTFDIGDDKRRNEVGKVLNIYGFRVQRSVFEIDIKNSKELQRLVERIENIIDRKVDSVRFYAQCKICVSKAREIGDFAEPFDRKTIYIF